MTELNPSPLVSVVILNWNGAKYIQECLESVRRQTHAPLEIVVVDNGSTDGSFDGIKRASEGLVLVDNGRNLGFAAGMNAGIRASSGAYVLPLNLDVFLSENYVATCIAALGADPALGVVGGKELVWENGQRTERLGTPSSAYFLRKRIQGYISPEAEISQESFGTTGSFPLMRRAMLDDLQSVSGHCYDEDFETGWEDLDLWFRMQLRGWKCRYLPDARAWHVGSASDDENKTLLSKSRAYRVRILRNRYFLIEKNLPTELRQWLAPWLFLTEILLWPYFLLRSPSTLGCLVEARRQVRAARGPLAAKREAIQKSARVSSDDLKRYFRAI